MTDKHSKDLPDVIKPCAIENASIANLIVHKIKPDRDDAIASVHAAKIEAGVCPCVTCQIERYALAIIDETARRYPSLHRTDIGRAFALGGILAFGINTPAGPKDREYTLQLLAEHIVNVTPILRENIDQRTNAGRMVLAKRDAPIPFPFLSLEEKT